MYYFGRTRKVEQKIVREFERDIRRQIDRVIVEREVEQEEQETERETEQDTEQDIFLNLQRSSQAQNSIIAQPTNNFADVRRTDRDPQTTSKGQLLTRSANKTSIKKQSNNTTIDVRHGLCPNCNLSKITCIYYGPQHLYYQQYNSPARFNFLQTIKGPDTIEYLVPWIDSPFIVTFFNEQRDLIRYFIVLVQIELIRKQPQLERFQIRNRTREFSKNNYG